MIKLKNILKENNLYEAFADSTELQTTISYLKSKNKVLLLTTSNRWEGDAKTGDVPKSTILAQSPEFAKTVLFQFPLATHPAGGYEQATAPGVVAFVSNKALFIGAIIVQFPSTIDKSSGGIAGFLSPLL